ncbi:polysaccharide pyruvyl transferase family protein, partial [bacterium]
MSLRVGVLTFHRPINYGSYWQARLLVEGLRAMGHQAELIDHDSPAMRTAERRLSLRPTLPTPVPREDVPRYKEKIRIFDRAHEALPRSCSVPLQSIGGLDPYDVVVIGSDEVWNLRHPLYGGRVAFYGVKLPARRIVSYAASFGNFSCWEGLSEPWSELISLLDAVSVRDENSWWMLKHALGREVPLVLDPCLQFDLPEAGKSPIEGAYALVYGHN